MFDYSGRLESLRAVLAPEGVDALLLGPSDHLRYLTGWCESAGERFLGLWVTANGEPVVVAPALYREDIETGMAVKIRVASYPDGEDWARLLPCEGVRSDSPLIAVDEDLSARHCLHLLTAIPHVRLVGAERIMQQLRGVKSPDELHAMERSAAVADAVYEEVLPLLSPGVTERDLQKIILDRFAAAGAETAWAIVAFGPNASRPHHVSGETKLEDGMVVVLDLGGSVSGYQSDITRTVAVGHAVPEAESIYAVVYAAHMAALEAARPGIRCQDVDRAARHTIESAGYGDRFIHRTGHGIGLSTHEPPNLSPDDDTVLRVGMCFSDEPGIYIPGQLGIRIENIITIEEGGARSLNASPSASLPVVGR